VGVLVDKILVARTLHYRNQAFISRFVSYFDGEKDPRNLMIVFSLLRVPASEWDVSSHAQVSDISMPARVRSGCDAR
jgi:hypothetical protein